MALDLGAPAGTAASGPARGTPDAPRTPERWALIAILALGAALRFTTISEQSFWFDEASTYNVIAHGFGHLVATIPRTESTPPLYYVLVWLWTRLFGVGEVGMRSFSAVCGIATIGVVWWLGRRLVSERAGLIAALLTAVNPLLFWYSQEARSYALLLLISTVSLLVFARALDEPSDRRWLSWGLTAAVALTVHYFAAFLLVPEGLWLLYTARRDAHLTGRKLALAVVPPALLAVPLGLLAIHQNDGRANFIATSGSLPYRVAQLVKEDLIGQGQPDKVLLGTVGVLVVILASALLARRGSPTERSVLLYGAIGAAGVLLAAAVSAVGTDYFNTRNMLPAWPGLALAVAAGLGVRRSPRTGAAGTAVLCVLSLFCVATIITNPAYQRDNWRGAARAIGPLTTARAILADRFVSYVPLQVYLPHLRAFPAQGVAVREVDTIYLERGSYGHDVLQVRPAALPGFGLSVSRTSSYVVIRYRAPKPVLVTPAALRRVYPDPYRGRVLFQR